jgi:hypothetical protein
MFRERPHILTSETGQTISSLAEFSQYALTKTLVTNEEEYQRLAISKGFPELAAGDGYCIARYNKLGNLGEVLICVNRNLFGDRPDLIPYTIAHEISEIYLNYQKATLNWDQFIRDMNQAEESDSHFNAENFQYLLAFFDGKLKDLVKFHQSMKQKGIENIRKDHAMNPYFILQPTIDYELKKMKITREMSKKIPSLKLKEDEVKEAKLVLTIIKDWLYSQHVG